MSTRALFSDSNVDQIAAFHKIVEGLAARDSTAATEFHRLFGKLISGLVWRLLGADPEHDDVVHQVYLNVLSSIKSLRDPTKLEFWVRSIAINTVHKELYRRKYRRMLRLASEEIETKWATVDPANALALQRFYAIIKQMRPNLRIVFVLHFVEGYKLSEISALCNFSVPTAKRRLGAGKMFFLKLAQKDSILSVLMDKFTNGS